MKDNEKAFDATEYKNKYQKEKYDRIIVNVPKGEKERINEDAMQKGYKSLNSYIVDAIHAQMNRKR